MNDAIEKLRLYRPHKASQASPCVEDVAYPMVSFLTETDWEALLKNFRPEMRTEPA